MVQGIEQASFSDPATALILAIAITGALTLFALRSGSGLRKPVDPLSGFFAPARFAAEIEETERRTTPFKPRGAILHGQIDNLRQVRTLWGPEIRADAVRQVAQVMRAGVRKSDMVVGATDTDSEGSFTILADGASEAEASRIAKRLLKTLSRTKVLGIGDGIRLTASFGVAARRLGESETQWRARADAALTAAQNSGENQIITASEWEEIILLPAPVEPNPENKAA
ncbi:GGDEF domain-containing protein [Qipengyuania sp. ASV99]|uniref:GGDEF domain-containing protein n=1 Tax=Qipengyuania sp. ASV99 TaxID=3399681 RepID=UPI003A4C6FB6